MKNFKYGALFLFGFYLISIKSHGQDPNFHIYLCFGQSNMEGHGPIEAQDLNPSVDTRFQVMGTVTCSNSANSYTLGKWQTAKPPIFRCETGLGPTDYFGRTMVTNLPTTIKVGVVPVAVGGCDIALFDKVNYQSYVTTAPSWMVNYINEYGGDPYGRLVQAAKLAQKDGVIKGILFHQGETNNGQSTWPAKVKAVYDNLIVDLGLDPTKTPFLAGELVTTAMGGVCGGHNSLIAKLPSIIPNAHVISAAGLACESDGLHFTSASYRIFGPRYAQMMLSLLPPSCTTAAPTVASSRISYEVGDVSKPLSATGTSLKWYTMATGGTGSTTAPTPTTSLAGATTYYVSQTAGGCESARSSITVTVVNTYKIFKTPSPIVVDGIVEDIWNNTSIGDAVLGKVLIGTISNAADLAASFRVLWDDSYLYVLANVTDQTLINDSPNPYDDDAVEVYVDINNDKSTTYGTNDVQYTFGWNDGTTVGVLPTSHSTAGITYKAVNKTGGYLVEASIPWSTLLASPAANQLLGIEFMVNDDDDGGTRDKKIAWTSTTDNAYQDPSLFGTAKLMNILITGGIGNDPSLSDGSNIYCYPNPFVLECTIVAKEQFSYQLMNQMGQVLEANQAYDKATISQEYPKGVYLVKIFQQGKSTILKLIKE